MRNSSTKANQFLIACYTNLFFCILCFRS